MKAALIAAIILAVIVYIQLILGGIVLLKETPTPILGQLAPAHVGLGHTIWIIALIATIILWRMKPPSKFLRWGGVLLTVLTFIQANILGALRPWTQAWVMEAHGMNAALLFAVAVALAVVAWRTLPLQAPSKQMQT